MQERRAVKRLYKIQMSYSKHIIMSALLGRTITHIRQHQWVCSSEMLKEFLAFITDLSRARVPESYVLTRVTVIPIWHLFRTIQLGSSRHHTAGGCIPQHQDDWNMTRIATWWSSHEEKLTEPFTQIQMRMGDAEEVRGSEALKFLVLANVCPGLVLGGGVRRPKLNCNIWMLEWQELEGMPGHSDTQTHPASPLSRLCVIKCISLVPRLKVTIRTLPV